jgi:hypothetical protein
MIITWRARERCEIVRSFCHKNLTGRDHLEDVDVDGRKDSNGSGDIVGGGQDSSESG